MPVNQFKKSISNERGSIDRSIEAIVSVGCVDLLPCTTLFLFSSSFFILKICKSSVQQLLPGDSQWPKRDEIRRKPFFFFAWYTHFSPNLAAQVFWSNNNQAVNEPHCLKSQLLASAAKLAICIQMRRGNIGNGAMKIKTPFSCLARAAQKIDFWREKKINFTRLVFV